MHWREVQTRRRERAARLYDASDARLETLARETWHRGFSGGAEWMRVALGTIRGGSSPQGCADFTRLGVLKYFLCAAAAVSVFVAARQLHAPLVLQIGGAGLAFYLIEAQFVFLFPLALDGGGSEWQRSIAFTRRAGGTIHAVATVLPIAASMLTRGLRGWCCGCLEVLLWYEDVRNASDRLSHSRLVWGDGGELAVRKETLVTPGLSRRVRIAWLSDLHLVRRTGIKTVRASIRAVRRTQPDVIVLGGDLVDGSRGLRQLDGLVRSLSRIAPVWALPGNHDEAFGAESVATVVRATGGGWLPDGVARVNEGEVSLVAGEFRWGMPHPGGVIVACQHSPSHAERWSGQARVVLAGHLHGGQVVLVEAGGKSWPCALRYRWCGPRFELSEKTTLLVGRGAGDLLPLRWNCPRELLCIDLQPAEKNPGGDE